MIWPFRHCQAVKDIEPEQDKYDTIVDVELPPLPRSIPLKNTPYEDIITEFLEEARRKAEPLHPGAAFALTLSEDKRGVFTHPVQFIGPVMMRAHSYGLEPGGCYNWEQTFVKVGSPS